MLEKCHNLEKISSEDYMSQMAKLLTKYQNLSPKIKDFNLSNFIEVTTFSM